MKLLFISGILRSGTTLLTRALGAHPEIITAYQPFAPFFKLWREKIYRDCMGLPMDLSIPMGIPVFTSDYNWNRFIDDAGKVIFNDEDIVRLRCSLLENLEVNSNDKLPHITEFLDLIPAGNVIEVLKSLFEIISNCFPGEEAVVVGFKEIWCLEFLEPMITHLDTMTIHILRDPRAVLASRNTGKQLEACGGERYPLLLVARAWRNAWSIEKRLHQIPNAAFVQYENLIQNPEEVLRELSGFLGVDYHQDMATPSVYKNGVGSPWYPNSTTYQPRQFNRSSLTYWKTSLRPEEIGAIEYLCSREMTDMKYTKIYPQFGKEEFLLFEEDVDSIRPWLRNTDCMLTNTQKNLEILQLESALKPNSMYIGSFYED